MEGAELTEYERVRLQRIERNRALMAALDLPQAASELAAAVGPSKGEDAKLAAAQRLARLERSVGGAPPRRSQRIRAAGSAPGGEAGGGEEGEGGPGGSDSEGEEASVPSGGSSGGEEGGGRRAAEGDEEDAYLPSEEEVWSEEEEEEAMEAEEEEEGVDVRQSGERAATGAPPRGRTAGSIGAATGLTEEQLALVRAMSAAPPPGEDDDVEALELQQALALSLGLPLAGGPEATGGGPTARDGRAAPAGGSGGGRQEGAQPPPSPAGGSEGPAGSGGAVAAAAPHGGRPHAAKRGGGSGRQEGTRGAGGALPKKMRGGSALTLLADEIDILFQTFDERGRGAIGKEDVRRVAEAHDLIWSSEELEDMVAYFSSAAGGDVLRAEDFRQLVERCTR